MNRNFLEGYFMKKQIYIICLTIFCGLLIVGCSSDNLGEQDNKNETE